MSKGLNDQKQMDGWVNGWMEKKKQLKVYQTFSYVFIKMNYVRVTEEAIAVLNSKRC